MSTYVIISGTHQDWLVDQAESRRRLSSSLLPWELLWKSDGWSLLEFLQSRILCNNAHTWHEFAGFNKLITVIAAAYYTEHWLDITTMRFSRLQALDCDEAVDHAVEVVEEGQQVEGKFNPALPLQEIMLEMHTLKWFVHICSRAPGTCSRCPRSWWRLGRRDQLQTSRGGSCTWCRRSEMTL